jgi:protein-S-isoprenylcysteine O-methyltransferase Ste14
MNPFHVSFILLFLLFIVVRGYYHRKSGTLGESIDSEAENKAIPVLRRWAGAPWIIGVLVYMIYPPWMAWSALPLPDSLRWVGVAFAAATIALLIWIHHALNKNFSTQPHIRDDHTLVTSGPYRWVRHPMYPTLMLFSLAAFLLSANWFIGAPPILIVALIMITRPPREEQQLVERFGDEYREYMKRTGRFLPRLSW